MNIPFDLLRQIMIYYINNNEIIYNNCKHFKSILMNDIINSIVIRAPMIFTLCKSNLKVDENYVNNDCCYINNCGVTALTLACYNKNNVAFELLNYDCKPGQVDSNRNTALTIACSKNLNKVALKLLDMDCKPNIVDCDNNTALIYACKNRMENVALKLLTVDCKPEHVDNDGNTALLFALKNNLKKIIPILLDTDCNHAQMNNQKENALAILCREYGTKSSLETLLKFDIPINNVDAYKYTPLMLACSSNKSHYAHKLLSLGCKTDCVNCQSETALILACKRYMTSTALEILDHTCFPDAIDYQGFNALIIATTNNMTAVVLKMLDMYRKEIDVNKYKMTLLQIAEKGYMYDIISKLNQI